MNVSASGNSILRAYNHEKTAQADTTPGMNVAIKDQPELNHTNKAAMATAIPVPIAKSRTVSDWGVTANA
ncbi:hypothetical protein DSM21852_16180 [Methylocystis bryophila]|nr:hypothetical protein DSM21852_16180 [Methylocystis bryophila]